ncbi:MAG: dihydropteroate synthase [Acidobacteriota bacterium]
MLVQRLARLWGHGRPAVMGIVNVTPDSFSDGGRYLTSGAAVVRGGELVAEGADIIDVGGESTRPGAAPVTEEVERERVVPVIAALARSAPEALLSVDTSKASVAAAALDAGAHMINDVRGGRDRGMLELVASRGAAVVLMHMRGEPRTMQNDTAYGHVVAEVHGALAARRDAALAAGISGGLILLDPGIGFGKDRNANLRLLAALGDLAALGQPVVVGASRKSFVGDLTGAATLGRLAGSLGAIAGAVALPRAIVRVHDVAATVQFLTVLAAVRGAA